MSLIRSPREVVRAIDFTGVQNGAMHPTDIDCVLEFNNDILILMEVKQWGKEIPLGQRLLLERLCDAWRTPRSTVLKVDYKKENVGEYTIDLHECFVTKYYYEGQWSDTKTPVKLIEFINHLGKKWNCDKCRF
jgi:hypothetical protein